MVKNNEFIDFNIKRVATFSSIIVFVIFLLCVLWGGWYTVDAGEKGIQLRNGAVTRVVDAGLYFKMPFFDSVTRISTRTDVSYFNNLSSYSKDQQAANVVASVTFRIPAGEAEKVYLSFKTIEELISYTLERQLPNQVQNVFGKYSAIDAVQKREQFVIDVTESLRESLKEFPIIIESVQIEKIAYSKAYEQSVEDRMRAEVEVQTQIQNLQREKISAEIAVTKAQAIADSTLAQAKAAAEAVILKGEAESKAILAKTEALKQNAALIELTKAERWDGRLPQTMLPNTAIPFIDAKK
ncbi:Band 7 protein [Gilliamella sp. wkB18]|uniref:prohibitin family protein n=1 Tax=Gilliamella sp. wkB18 TaxID=3120260 RepID=UPI00080E4695|nr:prohibitin family protein [Gilliamella apicola]OCG64096.1 Band 7 protein [Gilliamella apicola]